MTITKLHQKPYTGAFSMSGSAIKLIACICMLIDHAGAAIVENYAIISGSENVFFVYYLMRYIGRIAFPLFAFLLAEGFVHTHSVKKYAINLFVFAFLSEIPFDLALQGGALEFESQNVYFTLFLGVLAMASFDYVLKIKSLPKPFSYLFCAVCAAFFAAVAYFLKTDYDIYGVLVICAAYFLRQIRTVGSVVMYIILMIDSIVEKTAILAALPITLYNGKRGNGNKYFFYFFYPVHLLILYGIKLLLI